MKGKERKGKERKERGDGGRLDMCFQTKRKRAIEVE